MPNATVFLDKASESLSSAEDDFASRRFNACARNSYYASFQAAVAALIDEGILPSGQWTHKFVATRFSGILVGRRKLYPSGWRPGLAAIQEARLRADYSDVSTSEPIARRSLVQAREFVHLIGRRFDGSS
jgi:uncharacterized protein (UPF0332 family)